MDFKNLFQERESKTLLITLRYGFQAEYLNSRFHSDDAIDLADRIIDLRLQWPDRKYGEDIYLSPSITYKCLI